jgi:hypothetical protein
MLDPERYQELEKGLIGALFEKSAESSWTHMGEGANRLKADILLEILQGIFIYYLHSIAFIGSELFRIYETG